MIFVTIGTQEPFNRMIEAVDEVASQYPAYKFIAQVNSSTYEPKNLKSFRFINPIEFDQLFSKAKLVVSHAGMGTILSALTLGKPIIIMPRKAVLGEHRNEHQMATAIKIKKLDYAYVAMNELELKQMVSELLKVDNIPLKKVIGKFASYELVTSIRDYISK